jgi:hypothetical protein
LLAAVVDVDYLNWIAEGGANRWGVVHWNFGGDEDCRLKGGRFARCLVKMLRQEYSGLAQPSSLKPA